jgi:hypothetical protein
MRSTARLVAAAYLACSFAGCGTSDLPLPADGGGANHDASLSRHDAAALDAAALDAAALDAAALEDGSTEPLPLCKDEAAVVPRVVLFDVARGLVVGDELGSSEITLAGRVTGIGQGSIPSAARTPAITASFDSASTRWLELTAGDGGKWIVLLERMPHGFGVADGSAVSLRYFHYFGGWDPVRDALELRVGGQLAFCLGIDSEPSQLRLPSDVQAARGDGLCKQETGCGDYALYELELSVDGLHATLGTSQTAELGAYDVWHARSAEQLGPGNRCADWFVADVTLSLVHREELFKAPGVGCKATSFSSLPGVHIEIDDTDCELTLQQAMAGVTFQYRVVVDQTVPGVTTTPQGAGGCHPAHESGLYLGERIFGGTQHYCVCDQGICPAPPNDPITLDVGTYAGTFDWDGHNWDGPSDTGNPKGALFPAGTYTFEVKAAGTSPSNFEVRAGLTFTLQ